MHFLFDVFLFRFVGLISICEEFRELDRGGEVYHVCFETSKRRGKGLGKVNEMNEK